MSTETLQRSTRSPLTQGAMPGIIASTLAIALTGPSLLNDTPTYVTSLPSEFINSFFSAEHTNTDMQKIIFSIRSYGAFEYNWDGYSGKPPTNETIKDSISFLKKLPANISLPYPGLSGDGEVSLFWDKNGVFIDIGFIGDHKYSYYARDSDGKEFFGNYVSLSSDLPLDLFMVLTLATIIS